MPTAVGPLRVEHSLRDLLTDIPSSSTTIVSLLSYSSQHYGPHSVSCRSWPSAEAKRKGSDVDVLSKCSQNIRPIYTRGTLSFVAETYIQGLSEKTYLRRTRERGGEEQETKKRDEARGDSNNGGGASENTGKLENNMYAKQEPDGTTDCDHNT